MTSEVFFIRDFCTCTREADHSDNVHLYRSPHYESGRPESQGQPHCAMGLHNTAYYEDSHNLSFDDHDESYSVNREGNPMEEYMMYAAQMTEEGKHRRGRGRMERGPADGYPVPEQPQAPPRKKGGRRLSFSRSSKKRSKSKERDQNQVYQALKQGSVKAQPLTNYEQLNHNGDVRPKTPQYANQYSQRMRQSDGHHDEASQSIPIGGYKKSDQPSKTPARYSQPPRGQQSQGAGAGAGAHAQYRQTPATPPGSAPAQYGQAPATPSSAPAQYGQDADRSPSQHGKAVSTPAAPGVHYARTTSQPNLSKADQRSAKDDIQPKAPARKHRPASQNTIPGPDGTTATEKRRQSTSTDASRAPPVESRGESADGQGQRQASAGSGNVFTVSGSSKSTSDLRYPTTTSTHDLRYPNSSRSTQDLRNPVLTSSHDLRNPSFPSKRDVRYADSKSTSDLRYQSPSTRDSRSPTSTSTRDLRYPDSTSTRDLRYPDSTSTRDLRYPDSTSIRDLRYPDSTSTRDLQNPSCSTRDLREPALSSAAQNKGEHPVAPQRSSNSSSQAMMQSGGHRRGSKSQKPDTRSHSGHDNRERY